MAIKSDWWRHLPKDKQADRKEVVETSKLMREATRDVLRQKLEEVTQAQQSKGSYEQAAWPYLQADYIGYRRALSEMIDLLTIED